MKYFGEGLSEQHKELSRLIRKENEIERAKGLFLDIHTKLNLSEISNSKENEVDKLFKDLNKNEYSIMPTKKDETIAWVLWHIARIEDLTMGILVDGGGQVFDSRWKRQLNVHISDTGNALSDDEIMELSAGLDMKELIAYRNAVGQRTQDIVKSLSADDMKRRVSAQGLEAVKQSSGVTDQEESLWLLDFWEKKDVAGLLLMPPTRHVILHLNDCGRWKQHIRDNKKCFRRA